MLSRLARVSCDTSRLPSAIDLAGIARSADGETWQRVAQQIEARGLNHNPAGVNPGDRRMLSALAAQLQPTSVLEVGTHIGSSTMTIAGTLAGTNARITSVDIVDVNDPVTRPWERAGSHQRPAELVRGGAPVQFVVSDSLTFLRTTTERFDFVFLDGDHSARTVYQELPLAISRLTPSGLVLLHDYFPHGEPLWSNGAVIYGPWLATERLIREGARLRIEPLGELPWPTKLGTRVTSLAVALRAD